MAQAVKVMANQGAGSGAGSEGAPGPSGIERLREWLRQSGQTLTAWPQRSKRFVHEVRVEMGHVTWPALVEVRSTTFIVIVTIFFFGAFFFVVDLGVSKVVELILKRGKS